MAATTTVTIRVSAEVKEKLGRLARDTRRSRAFLAAEAVAEYVDRELEIIEGIERGRADVRAGRTVPHEEAMAFLYAAMNKRQGRPK
jgi:predicted transcriptional regulator